MIRVAPEGKPFIAGAWLLAALLSALAPWWLLVLWLPIAIWVIAFFRDPERTGPRGEKVLIAPADGVVVSVTNVDEPDYMKERAQRVSIFMNVFNVHVNRTPVDGTVVNLAYRPGKFFNASLDKASEFNERQAVALRLADGRDLVVVQIAGLVARRIRCDLRQSQAVRTGERFGLIRFGSRVDVYLPEGVAPLVVPGQTTIAGETVIADLAATEAARHGEER